MPETQPPAKRPCASCPYRRDVPSGVWRPEEYAKLPPYDYPTGEQPLGLFLCHQQDGKVCAGWAGCHDMDHNLAVRIEAAVNPTLAALVVYYRTDVPLFDSGSAAAEHGLAEVESPGPKALRTIEKVERKRTVFRRRKRG